MALWDGPLRVMKLAPNTKEDGHTGMEKGYKITTSQDALSRSDRTK